jgi:SAM-dependent methyltransferase
MKRDFQTFQSPIKVAHHVWDQILSSHHTAIDATCGGGYDTQFLAQRCRRVLSLDIQAEALIRAKSLLSPEENERTAFYHQSHEDFPEIDSPIHLVVYNLGYLPGGDKTITTLVKSTLTSIRTAIELISPGGLVSIICYPGHNEGKKEKFALLKLSRGLCPHRYSVSHQSWINRSKAPSLFIIHKIKN